MKQLIEQAEPAGFSTFISYVKHVMRIEIWKNNIFYSIEFWSFAFPSDFDLRREWLICRQRLETKACN